MATIIANRKNGRIISYRFRAYLGRNEFGEQIARYTTWHIPEGLTPSKAAKAAEKAALVWERHIKETVIIASLKLISYSFNRLWFQIWIQAS